MDQDTHSNEGVSQSYFDDLVHRMQSIVDELDIAPYEPVTVLRHIRPLRELLPEAQSVRVDRMFATARRSDATPERLIFENRKGAAFLSFVSVIDDPDAESRMYKHLCAQAGLTPDQAGELVRICDALIRANPMGAWCMRPAEPEGRHVEHGRFAGHDLPEDTFLPRLTNHLSSLLPEVRHIRIHHQVRARIRRQWCQFINHAGLELASIDCKALSLHLRALALRPDINLLDLNILRCCIWSRQLGCPLEALGEVMRDLMTLTSVIQASSVCLVKSSPGHAG